MDFLVAGLSNVFTFESLLAVLIGTLIGIIMGALPGVGPALAIALTLPFTFGMAPETSLILLGSIFSGSVYGGSISAILINTPGTPGNAATSFDGYPMTRKGEGGIALGISAMSSAIGGIISILVLSFFSPLLANIAVHFGAAEQCMLGLLGLSVVSLAADNDFLKGWISAGLGLMLSMVGFDLVTGEERFTFGWDYLYDGLQFIPLMVGLFAITQVLTLAQMKGTISGPGHVSGGFLKGALSALKYRITLIRSALIGVMFGTVPALGLDAAAFFAYITEKRSAKKEAKSFGKGLHRAVVAPEAANNAVVGGSLIPTLALGIPGSAATAVLLGGLIIVGITPGSKLFTEQAGMVGTFFVAMLFAQIAFLLMGLLFARPISKIVTLPNEILLSGILILATAGSFAIRNSLMDVIVCLTFGVIGYIFIKTNFNIVCFVLAFLLGPIIETGFQRALVVSGGSYSIFFTRPISLVLFVLVVLMILYGVIRSRKKDNNVDSSLNM
ncbi:tripartite tricarboxylate transporter permease [Alteribacillus sp. YIM 98480]|uniref:tripartite tricarboxylate transporter permease n=1 Tax=Alteribacillus sp. YIM 98480 TaxID=2606599 RepID=UPI00131BB849|nr:tripartite tricarboxylate transporter permease [Alteribacillus sp. YIM 98480]